MDTFELETMATEMEADAKAIVTLALDVTDDPSDEDGNKLLDDHTLVALTIMIAESRPEEKEMMISVVMNCIG